MFAFGLPFSTVMAIVIVESPLMGLLGRSTKRTAREPRNPPTRRRRPVKVLRPDPVRGLGL